MIVLKFGGTSVGDPAAIDRAVEIVRSRIDREPIVVVSAMGGVTDALLEIAEQAAGRQLIVALSAIEGLRARHLAAAEALLPSEADCTETCEDLSAMFDELAHLAEALSVLGDLTPRSRDALAAMGERLSSQLITAVFRHRGLDAVLVDAREVMITDGGHGRARPLDNRIAEASRRVLLPHVRRRAIPILGGFIGASEEGITTTLGRGGSDYSAALIGAALGVEAIEIWTDVDGMLTADPRIAGGARLIPRIRFDEASELAAFGARVLHPSTIAPAVRLGIPVIILNAARPEGAGTLITSDAPGRVVTAIAGRRGVALVKVRTGRMLLAHGFLRAFFEIFERHRVSVDVVATSEVSVSVTVDDAARLDGLIVDLRILGDVSVERGRGLLAVVGASLAEDATTMARAVAALAGVHVHLLSLSATGINLTLVVDEDAVTDGVRRLHRTFFEEEGAR
ncbi:MAG TPA: lysine-sensitive aspartokinase 3 [Gemmatimonadaceae bacterium]|nr:lysine-sensitive aspartokinase 3 [Gemmatimonadaceae bacterium]